MFEDQVRNIKSGGEDKYHEKNEEKDKLFVRDRLSLLLDPGFEVEDGLFANWMDDKLAADGVVTVVGKIHGRTVCVMANDSTIKAGSWGKRTVEKILRIQETAYRMKVPLIYLVDSAGARITDQVEMFPGRRGAGRIFYNESLLSGVIPQLCVLFGPSAAGGAYIPAFCDITIMVKGNASMYLGSPRMAEMVVGEKVTLEEMGGAQMHCSVSGLGDILVEREQQAINIARKYISYFPQNCDEKPEASHSELPGKSPFQLKDIIPEDESLPFDMYELLDRVLDGDTFLELKELFAPELITGLAKLDGKVVGVLANNSNVKGGILFSDSANKACRFIQLCDAFNIPLLFLVDVPGFMIGSAVEKTGIIRAGAKMILAVSEATVPKISVIVRKAYGAGLYAMCGPAYKPDACIALPTAQIAVMGPEAAVNAVYYNKIKEKPEKEREEYVEELREEFKDQINVYNLASELIIDAVVSPSNLRKELIQRFASAETRTSQNPPRKHSVMPM